jgi:hypothetical protein
MKAFNTKNLAVAFASLFLFSCERNADQDIVEPMQASQQQELRGYDPTTCNLIQDFGEGTLPRKVDVIEENRAVMIVKAQRRDHNGKYLPETEAVLLDAHDPATDLVNFMDARFDGMTGLLTVGDESGLKANRTGGRITLDFTPVSSVTMKTMVFTDISEEDKGSKVELYSRTGQLLEQKEIPANGKNAVSFVWFDNIPAVAKIVVTFGNERSNVGSGAIARLQLCVEGEGRRDEVRSAGVHTLWLEYTGDRPTNVKATAIDGATSKIVYSSNGMKKGTMFKIAVPRGSSLGEVLHLETNRKERLSIPVNEDRTASLKKQYGSFRVVEARCTNYPLKLQD